MFKAFNQFQIQQLHPRQENNIGATKNGCDGNSIFPWVSNRCGKSRLKKLGKLLKALVIIGIKSEISRASTSNLEETACVFFVPITLKT